MVGTVAFRAPQATTGITKVFDGQIPQHQGIMRTARDMKWCGGGAASRWTQADPERVAGSPASNSLRVAFGRTCERTPIASELLFLRTARPFCSLAIARTADL